MNKPTFTAGRYLWPLGAAKDSRDTITSKSRVVPLFTVRDLRATNLDQETSEVHRALPFPPVRGKLYAIPGPEQPSTADGGGAGHAGCTVPLSSPGPVHPMQLWRNTPGAKAQAAGSRRVALSGGTDYRVTLGTTQPPSDAPVLAMIMAPRGDAGVRTELQGHTWGDSPGKSQLCLGPEGRTKPGRQCYREAVHISTFGVSIMQVLWMSPTSIGGVIEVAKVR